MVDSRNVCVKESGGGRGGGVVSHDKQETREGETAINDFL